MRINPASDAARSASDVPEWARLRIDPRDPESGWLWPRRCELYREGHTVHPTQVRVCHRSPVRLGRLESVEGNLITVRYDDAVVCFRNHEPERLTEIVGVGGVVRSFSSILQGATNHCFSILQSDRPWIPCDHEPLRSFSPDALADRLASHGGFLVPGAMAGEASHA
jgi:hypothetical protein